MSSRDRLASIAMAAAIVVAAGAARADETSTRYFDGLRRRGLFQLAEGICLRELADKKLKTKERSQITLEYSRTLAEHAKYKAGKAQGELWGRATQIIDDYLKANPNAPQKKRLQLQRCVVLVSKGEFHRWDAELFPYDETHRRKATTTLQRAIELLQTLEADLSGGTATPRRPVAGERASLRRHIGFQRAIAYVQLAELHPSGSAKRLEYAGQASAAAAPLARGAVTEPITGNSRIVLAVVSRLSGRHGEALDRLKALEKKRPPARVKHLMVVELMKNLLTKNLVAEADRILGLRQKERGGLPGELAYLKVRASVAMWDAARKAGDANRAAELLKQSQTDVAVAERSVGGYWGYRCRVLFDFLKDARVFGRDLTIAMRRARALFHDGQSAKAADQYAVAVRLAKSSNRAPLAAELAFTEGSLRLKNSDYERAAAVFRQLAADQPKHPRAADADLMAAYCLGRLYDSRRTKARRLTYRQALERHRRTFAKSATRHEAAWMLAAVHDYRRQSREALKLYLTIPPEHPRGAAAQVAVARCYDEIIERLRKLKDADVLRKWEIHATAQLGDIVNRFPKPPAAWNRAQVDVALRTARIQLNRTPQDYRFADALLDRILVSAAAARRRPAGAADVRNYWSGVTSTARQLRIVALAGTGRFEQARALLAGLSENAPTEVLAVLDGLMQVGRHAGPMVRQQLGALQLQAAQGLNRKRDQLKSAERKWLDRCLAQAYAATGRSEKAVSQYEALLAKSPRNVRLLRTVAELLLKSTARKPLLKARTHWRTLESMAKPGSNDWLTARYRVALCTFRVGEYAACAKLLKVTRLLYPKLGGGDLKKEFDDLSEKVAGKPTG
ncbi:MAG: tol-pal system YbgF family protein [Planctomycetaceae bacterium]